MKKKGNYTKQILEIIAKNLENSTEEELREIIINNFTNEEIKKALKEIDHIAKEV